MMLDATAGLWHANVGHGRESIARAAYEQMCRLETYHLFGRFANEPALALADRLAAMAPVAGSKVFLTSGGSDAVDLACKLARRHWQLAGRPAWQGARRPAQRWPGTDRQCRGVLLDAVRRSHDAAAAIALECPADVLMIPENLSSECVGKTFYEMFMREYEETWARRIHAAGKFSCIHLDGTMKGLLRETCSTSLTFIEALTPAPAGDLEIEKWAQWSGNSSTILWGGIPGMFFTELVSDEEFDQHTRHVSLLA